MVALVFFAPFFGAPARGQNAAAVSEQQAPFDSVAALARVRDFLNENPVIRVGIEGSGRPGRGGNGHQSTAATVVQRLRELGYRGLIQVIYEASEAARLEFLFPPFRSARGPFQRFTDHLNQGGIEFLESEYFRSRSPPETDLGLIGAADLLQTRHRLHVRRLLVFQPLKWWGRPAYIDDGLTFDSWDGNQSLPELTNLGFIFRVPTIRDPVRFIEGDMAHVPHLAVKTRGLMAIAEPRNHEVAAVYGHFISRGRQLLNYLGGISWAMRARPSEFQRGVVVPVFNAISAVAWARIRVATLLDSRLRGRVRFFDVEDTHLPSRIQSIGSDEIFVVRVGPAARRVFDYFMATSSIAPVVEGRNSANVMMLAGTAYLPSLRRELWHFADDLEATASALGEVGLQAVLGMTPSESRAPIDDDAHRAIGEFLLETRDPNSRISRRFESAHRALDPVRDDKIVRGLLIALERKNAGPPAWRRRTEATRPAPARRGVISCREMFVR